MNINTTDPVIDDDLFDCLKDDEYNEL